jgi:hypothetical protein
MKRSKLLIAALVGLLFVASGCSYFHKSSTSADQKGSIGAEAPNKVLYTFPGIPLPKELTLVREKSFIYEAPGIKAGVLLLSGNVEAMSLEEYFRISMPKNGWRFINSYKYGDTILNFTREERSSNIRIKRNTFNTEVEVWVGPIEKNQPASGQRNNDLR